MPSSCASPWPNSQRCRSMLRVPSKRATFNPAFFAAFRKSFTVSPNVRLSRLSSATLVLGSFDRPCCISFLVRVFLDSLPTLVYFLFRGEALFSEAISHFQSCLSICNDPQTTPACIWSIFVPPAATWSDDAGRQLGLRL